jgi:hypothetical protein
MKQMITIALLLVPISAMAGSKTAECDMKLLVKVEAPKVSEMPTLAARNKVFACAGIDSSIPKTYDELDKDLLFMAPTHMDQAAYMQKYNAIPVDGLKKLWRLVREFKAAQGASVRQERK